MDNKFTTVISYEKPIQDKQRTGNVMLSGDVGALMKALGFMVLWLVFTAMLLAEPLMLNSGGMKEKHDGHHFTLNTPPARLQNGAQNAAAKRIPHSAPANMSTKLNADSPSAELPPARLSYALLSIK